MNLDVLVSTLIIKCYLEMPWEDITRQIFATPLWGLSRNSAVAGIFS